MNLLFGFGNKARNGKDTAAEGIRDFCAKMSIPFLKVGFADALREEVTQAIRKADGDVVNLLTYGFIDEEGRHHTFPNWVVPTENPDRSNPLLPYGKHSKLLQWWGTDFRRIHFGASYWVNEWDKRTRTFEGVVVTPDARFINEAIAVIERGGTTTNVRRLNEDGTQFFDSGRPADHPSETELDPWNWDFRIIAKTGQASLVKSQAVEIAKYQMRLKNGWTE